MNNIPKHVAIIMDGNGRWATNKGKKRSEGHKEGAKILKRLVAHINNIGIEVLSVYAFSTDNFKRSEEEVDYLMNLLIYYFEHHFDEAIRNGVKVVFSGRKYPLKKDILKAIDNISNKSKDNNKLILNICLNYGGQEEIIDATKKIINDVNCGIINIDNIDRNEFLKYMYQDLPPIDLLIRTGGEHRLSNFMLYQTFYAEIYFCDTYFPDFDEKELDKAIEYYQSRDRRFGCVKRDDNK